MVAAQLQLSHRVHCINCASSYILVQLQRLSNITVQS